MSNFDSIINKTKKFIDVAGKKTGNAVEISKLKMSQINKEAELQEQYVILGKFCYKEYKNKENQSTNIRELIERIDLMELEIKDIKDKICLMKNAKTCKTCGNKNPKKAIYCSFCGDSLYPKEQTYNEPTQEQDNHVVVESYKEDMIDDKPSTNIIKESDNIGEN